MEAEGMWPSSIRKASSTVEEAWCLGKTKGRIEEGYDFDGELDPNPSIIANPNMKHANKHEYM
jgi:hypothetical protein